jgi:response regulator of citrate/malate metabolism
MTVDPPVSVLVVDDDFMVARLHARFLATLDGFEIAGIAHTGSAALETLGHTPVDLVLLDIYLPDMTGIDVLREVRRSFPAVDVLVVTAARELDTVRDAQQGGAVSYLIKPFEYSALGERLTQYRRTRRLLDDTGAVDQHQVDRLFGRAPTGEPHREDLPKGLSRETAEAVRALLSDDMTLSSQECADKVGISRVSARRYLEHLEHTGVAEVTLKYGTGRPERRYRLR